MINLNNVAIAQQRRRLCRWRFSRHSRCHVRRRSSAWKSKAMRACFLAIGHKTSGFIGVVADFFRDIRMLTEPVGF